MRATLSTDGGSRGNPGPAAYAYVLEAEDGTVLAAHGEAIGVATNNVAEYSALVAGLEKAVERATFGSTMRVSGAMGRNLRPACHAEGRGFESHHPLSPSTKVPLRRGKDMDGLDVE